MRGLVNRAAVLAGAAAVPLGLAAEVARAPGAATTTSFTGNPGEDYNPATGLGVPDLTKFAKHLAAS